MQKDPIRVLLVDDDEDDYTITRDLLAEIEEFPHELEYAATYETGLEAVRRQSHDVCLFDYRLGERSGLELMRDAIKTGCRAPIILLTGQGDHDVDIEAMKAGASDYLVKGTIDAALLGRSIRYAISHKHAEEALRRSQESLVKKHEELNRTFRHVEIAKQEWEGTMDCVGDMVLLADDEGKVKRCNKSLIEFTGKDYKELLNKDWKEIIPESQIRIGTVLGQGMEFFHKPSRRWFVLKSYPFRNMVHYGSGTVITLHDSTELKKMTEELEIKNEEINENREKLQGALDKASSLIQQSVVEKGFGVRFQNPDMVKCHEHTECQEKDCPCYGKDAVRCWQIVGTFRGKEVEEGPANKERNCSECPVFREATADPINLIGENFNNMMHILELKNNELEKAYAELKTTQTKILQQEKMASIGQLAAGVAHEINNPIGFIYSNLATLEKYVGRMNAFIEAQSEAMGRVDVEAVVKEIQERRKELKLDYIITDIKELIKESLEGADRVRQIVQSLKSFSRVDEAEHKYADINECLESTINIAWNELKYKTILTKEYGEVPLVKCYPQQLNQVFMNLLVNAAQAIEKQGEITVRTIQENGSIRVSISDTGSGIPKDKLDHIFEPFFTTKEAGKGTGLGLSITYDIIKKHDGDITVDSEVGKGTTFNVILPLSEGQ